MPIEVVLILLCIFQFQRFEIFLKWSQKYNIPIDQRKF